MHLKRILPIFLIILLLITSVSAEPVVNPVVTGKPFWCKFFLTGWICENNAGATGPMGPQGPAGASGNISIYNVTVFDNSTLYNVSGMYSNESWLYNTTVYGNLTLNASTINFFNLTYSEMNQTPNMTAGPQGPQGIQGIPGLDNMTANMTAGPQGPAGTPGTAATVNVNHTFTGATGSDANVVNVGTALNANLDFTIPSGMMNQTPNMTPAGTTSHNLLLNLTMDDHPQYANLSGRPGGQVLTGGTQANDDLILNGTSSSTKTTSYVNLQPNGGNVGIGTVTPRYQLHVNSQSGVYSSVIQLTTTSQGTLSTDGLIIFENPDNAAIDQQENLPLVFYTNASERARFTKEGVLLVNGVSKYASIDPKIVIGGSRTISGNGHGFVDESNVNKAGVVGYNSYDHRINFTGSYNYDHSVGFQSAATYTSSGNMTTLGGFVSIPTILSGTIDNMKDFYISSDYAGTGGVVLKRYGIYIAPLTKAVKNWAIYTEGNTSSYFGGPIQFDNYDAGISTFDAGGNISSQPYLAGTKTYYVSDTAGGNTTRKLTFTNGILTGET